VSTFDSRLCLHWLAGYGGPGFLQQAAGLRNQVAHFEGFHQVGHVIVVQEAADRAARTIAKIGRVDEEILQDAVDRIGTVI